MSVDEQVLSYPIPNDAALEPPAEWAELRSTCPVAHVKLPSGDRATLLTRYADVKKVLADPRFTRLLNAPDAARMSADENGGLTRTRLRNQADFYSLVGAADDILRSGQRVAPRMAARRLREFVLLVEDEGRRAQSDLAAKYYAAVRSASNDVGPRRERIAILRDVLLGQAGHEGDGAS